MIKLLKHFLKNFIKITMILVTIFVIGSSITGQAQGTITDLSLLDGVNCLIGEPDCLVDTIVGFLLDVAPAFAILVITWGGYLYFFGGLGSKTDGLKAVQAGVIGLIITLVARTVAELVEQVFLGGNLLSGPVVDQINSIIRDLLTPIATALAVLVITWGGYKYFFGGLDIDKEGGVKNIRSGVIGLVVVLLAGFISSTVSAVLATPGNFNAGPILDFIEVTLRNLLIPLAGTIAILVIAWGGYKYFFGGLDIDKEGGAKNIRNGITGLIVVLLAGFISSTVQGVLAAPGTFNAGPIIDFIEGILLTFLIPVAGTIAVLVIAWGGYKYFFGGLDIDKEGGAKNIRNGVTGLVVVLLAGASFNAARNLGQAVDGQSGAAVITILVDTFILPLINQGRLILFGLASAVAILVIIYGGYKYYFSGAGAAKEDGLKNIRSGIIGLVAVLLAQAIVSLIEAVFPAGSTFTTITGAPIIVGLTNIIRNFLLPASIALSIFFFILGGYYYITAGGNAEKVKKAQKATINAAIGLVVVLLAATVIQLIIFVVPRS